MATKEEVFIKLKEIGFSDLDSEALADSMVKGGSVSWVNNDSVSNEMLANLGEFIKQNNFKIRVSVQEVPNRGKYIWDVEC